VLESEVENENEKSENFYLNDEVHKAIKDLTHNFKFSYKDVKNNKELK